MEESILLSISKYIGLPEGYPVFDQDLLMLINSELSTLAQLGVVPDDGFMITGPDETWTDLLGENKTVQFVKEYIYIRVKMTFDPPQSSALLDNLRQKADELAFRIIVATDKEED